LLWKRKHFPQNSHAFNFPVNDASDSVVGVVAVFVVVDASASLELLSRGDVCVGCSCGAAVDVSSGGVCWVVLGGHAVLGAGGHAVGLDVLARRRRRCE